MKIVKLLLLTVILLATSAAAFWLYKTKSQLNITAPLDLSRAGSSVSVEFRPTYGQLGKIARLELFYGLYEWSGRVGKDYKFADIYDKSFLQKLRYELAANVQVSLYEAPNRLILQQTFKLNRSRIHMHQNMQFGAKKLDTGFHLTGFTFKLEPKNYKIIVQNLRDESDLNARYTGVLLTTKQRKY